jgi:hypothetical protein
MKSPLTRLSSIGSNRLSTLFGKLEGSFSIDAHGGANNDDRLIDRFQLRILVFPVLGLTATMNPCACQHRNCYFAKHLSQAPA